jgi:hypothetical protein
MLYSKAWEAFCLATASTHKQGHVLNKVVVVMSGQKIPERPRLNPPIPVQREQPIFLHKSDITASVHKLLAKDTPYPYFH